MTWKQNSLHLDTRSVWPQNPGSLCCAHTALLVHSSSTVKWSPCQSHFTIWQFGSQSGLRIFKLDSLRRKLIQKLSSIHLCTCTKLVPVNNGDSDWIGDCSDSSKPCLRWAYQGARLNLVHSKIPKPSITLIYQLVIYLPQCTDLLVLHRVICLCQHARDKNIISPSEGCVLIVPESLWLPLFLLLLSFCFWRWIETHLYFNEIIINVSVS